jgi:hypothetical protein
LFSIFSQALEWLYFVTLSNGLGNPNAGTFYLNSATSERPCRIVVYDWETENLSDFEAEIDEIEENGHYCTITTAQQFLLLNQCGWSVDYYMAWTGPEKGKRSH